jgi:hypothetical protein
MHMITCPTCGVCIDPETIGTHAGCVPRDRERVVTVRLAFEGVDLTSFGSRKDFAGVCELDGTVVAGVTADDIKWCRLEDVELYGGVSSQPFVQWLLALNVDGKGPLWSQICEYVMEVNIQQIEKLYRGL